MPASASAWCCFCWLLSAAEHGGPDLDRLRAHLGRGFCRDGGARASAERRPARSRTGFLPQRDGAGLSAAAAHPAAGAPGHAPDAAASAARGFGACGHVPVFPRAGATAAGRCAAAQLHLADLRGRDRDALDARTGHPPPSGRACDRLCRAAAAVPPGFAACLRRRPHRTGLGPAGRHRAGMRQAPERYRTRHPHRLLVCASFHRLFRAAAFRRALGLAPGRSLGNASGHGTCRQRRSTGADRRLCPRARLAGIPPGIFQPALCRSDWISVLG